MYGCQTSLGQSIICPGVQIKKKIQIVTISTWNIWSTGEPSQVSTSSHSEDLEYGGNTRECKGSLHSYHLQERLQTGLTGNLCHVSQLSVTASTRTSLTHLLWLLSENILPETVLSNQHSALQVWLWLLIQCRKDVVT